MEKKLGTKTGPSKNPYNFPLTCTNWQTGPGLWLQIFPTKSPLLFGREARPQIAHFLVLRYFKLFLGSHSFSSLYIALVAFFVRPLDTFMGARNLFLIKYIEEKIRVLYCEVSPHLAVYMKRKSCNSYC